MSELSEITSATRVASRLFRLISGIRSRHGIDLDETMVFFAVGRLTLDPTQSMMVVRPTNIASLSDFMGVPRETLRRKLIRLEEREMVTRTSSGFVVRDMVQWRRLAELAGDGRTEIDARDPAAAGA